MLIGWYMSDNQCPVHGHGESTRRWMSTDELFRETNEVTIVHNHQPYKLRITKNGKLILTK
ncbi:hemin uptake protein HemP [Neptuniibacter sp.]|uniref:hemin uptake protein HemP n=1 Tax=Neptuniibacter sp. TaxID=1962643 RepID=UPI00345B8723